MAMMNMPTPVLLSPVATASSAATEGHAALMLATARVYGRSRGIMARDYDRLATLAWNSVTFCDTGRFDSTGL
jgi:hypothetical protein